MFIRTDRTALSGLFTCDATAMGAADAFARGAMLAPKMFALASAQGEDGEIVVVGEIQFFWAPVLHVTNVPQPRGFRHPKSYAIARRWQIGT